MFGNLKVGVRLGGGFAVLIGLMMIMLIVALNELSALEGHIDFIVNDRVPKVVAAEELNKNTLDVGRQVRNLLLTEPAQHGAIKEKIAKIRETNTRIIDELDKSLTHPDARALLTKAKEARAKLGPQYITIFDLVEKDQAAAKRFIINDFILTNNEFIAASSALGEFQKKLMQNTVDEAHSAYVTARNTIIFIVLAAILISIATALLIGRSIVHPLHQIQSVVATVHNTHDFTVSVKVNSQDEVGHTAAAFNELLATLRQTLAELKQSIGQVAGASQRLVNTAGQSAQASGSTSEAASSMAASVEEMSVSINQVADNARTASGLAERAGHLSNEGGQVIDNTVTEMERIADTIDRVSAVIGDLGNQSHQISSIIQVIKDVADQTNLLALNAAIEAARAGEAGRGFAVVADEVRKLAERTTKATGEISQMITGIQDSSQSAVDAMRDTVDQVKQGRELAERAGTSIAEIRQAASEVVSVVADIADSIAEQSSASQSIAQQLEHVAQAAEEDNAVSSETAASANELGRLADSMRQTTDHFKI